MTLVGNVEIIEDTKLKEEVWQDWLADHFQDRKFCLLKFTAHEACLWIDGEFVTLEVNKEIMSRCGILCNECEYISTCTTCTVMDKPFWGDSCPVKDCCEDKKHEHCGECKEFPCDSLNSLSYDAEQGDDGKRIEQCKKWCCV